MPANARTAKSAASGRAAPSTPRARPALAAPAETETRKIRDRKPAKELETGAVVAATFAAAVMQAELEIEELRRERAAAVASSRQLEQTVAALKARVGALEASRATENGSSLAQALAQKEEQVIALQRQLQQERSEHASNIYQLAHSYKPRRGAAGSSGSSPPAARGGSSPSRGASSPDYLYTTKLSTFGANDTHRSRGQATNRSGTSRPGTSRSAMPSGGATSRGGGQDTQRTIATSRGQLTFRDEAAGAEPVTGELFSKGGALTLGRLGLSPPATPEAARRSASMPMHRPLAVDRYTGSFHRRGLLDTRIASGLAWHEIV